MVALEILLSEQRLDLAPHVAGGAAQQLGEVVVRRVFLTIDASEGPAAAEESLRQTATVSVFPTPVGPISIRVRMGLSGSPTPASTRLKELVTASMASGWPTTMCSMSCRNWVICGFRVLGSNRTLSLSRSSQSWGRDM